MWFWVKQWGGLGFGLGFGVEGPGFRVEGFVLRVQDFGFKVYGFQSRSILLLSQIPNRGRSKHAEDRRGHIREARLGLGTVNFT